MRNLVCFSILFFSWKLLAQEMPPQTADEYTAKDVKKMIVFPGCDKEKEKEGLINCFNRKINEKLSYYISDKVATALENKGYTEVLTKVRFNVNIEGKITNIHIPEGVETIIDKFAIEAMKKVASKVGYIEPAEIDNHEKVILQFDLPILVKVDDTQIEKFNWKEICIATLQDENSTFEIRQSKMKNDYLVYDLTRSKKLVGEFKTFEEILRKEPYNAMLKKGDGRLKMAEKKIGKSQYRIYYSPTVPQQIDVYEMRDGEEVLFESLKKDRLIYSKLYLEIVLRN